MFKLEDIRKSRVWQEAREEGRQEGQQGGRELRTKELVQKMLSKGHTAKEIAALLDLSVADVRRLGQK